MAESDPTDFSRHAIGAHPVQERLGVRTADVVLGETAQIEEADALVDGGDLVADDLEHIVAAVTVVLDAAVEREPLGPLPTEGLGVHGALGAQFLVQGTGLPRAAVRLFFAGPSRGVCRAVVEKYLVPGVGL